MRKLYTLLAFMCSFAVYSQTNSLAFDGSNDRVSTPYLGIADSSARTVEMWIKRNNTSSSQGIISEWGFGTGGDGQRFTVKVQNNHFRLEAGGTGSQYSIEGSTYINSTTWFHLAVVIDPNLISDRVKLYINGNLEASAYLKLNTNLDAGGPLNIGGRYNGVGIFNGRIDDYRIWNTARTQTEIQNNMNNEFCSLPTGLVSYFKFNDGTASGNNTAITSALDEVNPTNTNTLNNFSLSSGNTTSNFIGGNANLPLIVNEEIVNSCGSYLWAENGQTYTSSGTYDVPFVNALGCDSVVRLQLTVNTIDPTVNTSTPNFLIANMVGASYQWMECTTPMTPISGETQPTFMPSTSGNYAVELTLNGCKDTSICNVLTVSSTPVAVNAAFDFDGVDDGIATNITGITSNNNRTVEAWIKVPVNNPSTQGVIVDWGHSTYSGQRFTFNVLNQKLRLEVGGSGLNGNLLLNDGNWHHVAVTYNHSNNDTIRLFVDGILDVKGKVTNLMNSSSSNKIKIGKRVDENSPFTGSIDEVRIWSVVKSEAEIAAGMNLAICTFPTTGLYAYFPLNEGEPFMDNTGITSVIDYVSLNENAGTINLADMQNSTSNYVTGPAIAFGYKLTFESDTACESYTWTENTQEYTSSGIYSSATNGGINGCDSIVVLNLTINQAATGTDVIESCVPITWIDGNLYSTSNSTATHTFVGQALNGCDSIVTLNLTLHDLSNVVTDNGNGTLTTDYSSGTYVWLDCANNYAPLTIGNEQTVIIPTVGNYAVEVSEFGCKDTSNCVTVTSMDGFLNAALHFDGTADYVQTSFPGVLGNNAITVEAWVKTESINNEQIITTWGSESVNGGRFTFRLNASGSNDVIRIENKGDGLNGTTNVNDGSWHHVAVSYDPSLSTNKYKLFVDGNLDAQGNLSQSLNIIGTTDMIIGRRINPNLGGNFSGAMDEVRVWNVARTETEINDLMNSTICEVNPNLVAYFTYNEGTPFEDNTSISNLKDHANYTQDASLNDFTLDGATSNFVLGPNLPSGIDFVVALETSNCLNYTWAETNQNYTTSGNYISLETGMNGCDSVRVLKLEILQPTTGTDLISACVSYTWIDGIEYTSNNNTATFTIVGGAANGCDSTVTLNLTINQPTTGTDVISACGSYTWIDGVEYTASNNIAVFTLVGGSATGCDSTVTLDLTINQATTGTDVISACESYTWIDGIEYTASNNTAVFTIDGGASNGCDSIVTLNLTINQASTGTDVISACGSYTWIDGIEYTASNNTAEFTIIGGAVTGCDSIVSLDLTIINLDAQVTDNGNTTLTCTNTGVTYQWIDCNAGNSEIMGETNQTFEAAENGSYAVIVSDGTCSDTSSCFLIANVGLEDLTSNSIKLYPNPTTGIVTIELTESISAKIEVLDMNGRLVLSTEINSEAKTNLNLANLQPGSYVVKITDENYVLMHKIVLQ